MADELFGCGGEVSYEDFIARKAYVSSSTGITANITMPKDIKPFQADLVRWALKRGRAAIFASTGLGKTLMQLTWARAVLKSTGGRVIILTPLAVAQQTCEEAKKFGIDDVAYARDHQSATTGITVTNYDRIDKFDLGSYAAIVLDESSILKAHSSKTRIALTESCQQIPFRLACTATPAPNDWVELGNHAEFLGVASQKEMLSTYFVHDGSVRAGGSGKNVGEDGWRLKGHADTTFWQWVASWGSMIRHPRDLGYDDAGYDLPPLRYHQVTVPVEYAPSVETGHLFPLEARTMSERIGARRSSVSGRVAAAADIVRRDPDRPWLIWCNLNDESGEMRKALAEFGAVEVKGSDDADQKAERLLGFANGTVQILVSKASIAGFGMNFQRCSDMIFLGLNDSFEQVFQAVRRCWRFGQDKPVNVHMIASEIEGAVVANIKRKEKQHETMGASMASHMYDYVRMELEGKSTARMRAFNKGMELPTWLK